MNDSRKKDLLTEKFFILEQEQLKLIKEDKYDEAEEVTKEIDNVLKELEELTKKEYDQTMKESERFTTDINNRVKQFESYPNLTTEDEAEEYLSDIMRRK